MTSFGVGFEFWVDWVNLVLRFLLTWICRLFRIDVTVLVDVEDILSRVIDEGNEQ